PGRKVVDEIKVGERVTDLAGAGNWLFAVDAQKNELITLSREQDLLVVAKRHAVSGYPITVAVSPGGRRISVASLWSRRLAIFELNNDGEIRQLVEIPLPFNPREQQFAADDLVVVNDAFARRFCEVDLTTQAIAIRDGKISGGSDPSRRLVKGIEART